MFYFPTNLISRHSAALRLMKCFSLSVFLCYETLDAVRVFSCLRFAKFGQLLLLSSIVVSGDEYTHNKLLSQ